jgi:hypothetical protein
MGTAVQVKADAMRNVCQRKGFRTNPKGAKMACPFGDGTSLLRLEIGIVRERQRSGPRVLGQGRRVEGNVKNGKNGLNPLRGPSAALTAPNAMTTPGPQPSTRRLGQSFLDGSELFEARDIQLAAALRPCSRANVWSRPSLYLNIAARTMPRGTSAGAHWR